VNFLETHPRKNPVMRKAGLFFDIYVHCPETVDVAIKLVEHDQWLNNEKREVFRGFPSVPACFSVRESRRSFMCADNQQARSRWKRRFPASD
jgi:hypothetical protein